MNLPNILAAAIESLLFAGLLYGWPSLQHMLINGGYFMELCAPDAPMLDRDKADNVSFDSCPVIFRRLSLICSVSATLTCLGAWPFAHALNRYGARVIWSVTVCVFSTTVLMLGLVAVLSNDMLITAVLGLTFSVAHFLKTWMSLRWLTGHFPFACMHLLNGLLNNLALICVFLKLCFEWDGSPKKALESFTGVSALLWTSSFLLMPPALTHIPILRKHSVLHMIQEKYLNKMKNIVSMENSMESLPGFSRKCFNKQNPSECKTKLFSISKPPFCFFDVVCFSLHCLCVRLFVTKYIPWAIETNLSDRSWFHSAFPQFVFILSAICTVLSNAVADTIVWCRRDNDADKQNYNLSICVVVTLITSLLLLLAAMSVFLNQDYSAIVFFIIYRPVLFNGIAGLRFRESGSEDAASAIGMYFTVAGMANLLQFIFSYFFSSTYTLLWAERCFILSFAAFSLFYPIVMQIKSQK